MRGVFSGLLKRPLRPGLRLLFSMVMTLKGLSGGSSRTSR